MGKTTPKAPALPWYPKDFAADEPVIAMSLEAEGAYRRLLDHQWLHGSIPADFRRKAAICKGITVARMKRLWREMEMLFAPIPDDSERLQNAKLERVRQERQEFIERKREAGRLGAAVTNAAAKSRHSRPSAAGGADDVPPANGRPASASASASATAAEAAETSSTPARPGSSVHDPAMRCTIAANKGLRNNPKVGTRFNELATSNQGGIVGAWMLDGIDPDLAERVVYEKALAYEPKGRNTQPRSLAYFTDAVHEAHERECDRKARESAAAEIAEAERRKREASRPPEPEPARDPDAPIPDWRAELNRTVASVDVDTPAPRQTADERRQAVKRAAAEARQAHTPSTP